HGTMAAGIGGGKRGEDASDPTTLGNNRKTGASADRKHKKKTAPAVAFRRERDQGDNVMTTATPLKKISGMAPVCKLLSLKVLDENGEGKTSSLIAAIDYIQYLNGNGR